MTPSTALAVPFSGSGANPPFTPQEIRTAYGIGSIAFPGGVSGTGAGQTIAIVDAFDDPNIANDLQTFDARYGLPAPPSFIKTNQAGQTTSFPGVDSTGGWESEESLDVEWAHAIAPAANIVLVEANSAGGNALFVAAQTAAALPGVSVVSMSWGARQRGTNENGYDPQFNVPGVTFVTSSGDNGENAGYPADSPYVVGVGGTSLSLTNGSSYGSETAWSGSAGGTSRKEPRPSYQNGVIAVVGNARGAPDVSFDANPNTGVSVYDSYDVGGGSAWQQFGGTSLGAPAWAGLIAIADQGRVGVGLGTLSSTQTLALLYSLPSSVFNDITSGSNAQYRAGAGYDLVTGLGTPVANLLIPGLVDGANNNGGSSYQAVNVPRQGVYLYSPNASWQLLTQANASLLVLDAAGDLYGEFPGYGVQQYTSTAGWQQITPVDASVLAINSAGNLVGDFPGYGVWYFDNPNWHNLTPTDATALAINDFGTIVGAFSGYGTWEMTAAAGWQNITPATASILAIDAAGDIAANFAGYGVYQMTAGGSGWVNLTLANAVALTIDGAGNIDVSIAGFGVYQYQAATGWVNLTPTTATFLTVDAAGDISGEFGAYGVWIYKAGQGWSSLFIRDASTIASA